MIIEVASEADMKKLGHRLGQKLRGGELIELVGDVGAGKTTFTKGIATGLAIDEDVQSPSFTISRLYDARDGLHLAHYDFYRLGDAGIMTHELDETIHDSQTVTIIEWSDVVTRVLPDERLRIQFSSPSITDRVVELTPRGQRYEDMVGELV
jgi:tRNA threonylcarbamoyladenosine biosynthesis protein TsaE